MNTQSLGQTEPPHWQRVREERLQLFERVIKLRAFLGSATARTSIASEHIRLLELQLKAMQEYQNLLSARIELWEKEKDTQK